MQTGRDDDDELSAFTLEHWGLRGGS